MGRVSSTHGRNMYTLQNFSREKKRRTLSLGDIGVDGRKVLKWIACQGNKKTCEGVE